MALRFQTRLTLSMALLVAATLLVMAILVVTTVVGVIIEENRKVGRTVTQVARRNIGYGLSLPDKVMERVGEQMVVSALLTAELVAVAEEDAGMPPDQISGILKRVVERSHDVKGYPLIDEFWVSDETGRAYINSEGREFSFSPDSQTMPQASAFWKLLEPGAEPVIQDFQKREIDDRWFKYVGISGVDKPRIVQVGAGEQLVDSVEAEFSVQNILDRFALDLDFECMMVLDESGTVLASVGHTAEQVDGEVTQFCTDFLHDIPRHPDRPIPPGHMLGRQAEIDFFGSDVGVVTKLPPGASGQQRALFMLHSTDSLVHELRSAVLFFVVLSLLMLGVAVFLSIKLSKGLAKPVRQLVAGVKEFGKGNLDHRVQLTTRDEIQVLGEAFNGMAVSLRDHMRRLEEETRKRERLESELSIAAQLQRSLLPTRAPQIEGIELVGWSEPAREVGGDFYDYIEMPSGRLGVVIGDATDKGLPAALLIRQCWAVFRALSEEFDSPAELLARTNHALWRQVGDTGRFVTLFFMTVDAREGVLRYSMAGHNPPLLLGWNPERKRAFTCDQGLPLGIEKNCEFAEVEVPLEALDTIVLYSDGITEARGSNDLLYGDERLQRLIADAAHGALPDLLDRIRRDVEAHLDGRAHSDDMTLVGMRFAPSEVASLLR